MNKSLLDLSLAAAIATNNAVAETSIAPPSQEAIEWCDIWLSHANETKLPQCPLQRPRNSGSG
jgi:hypothetical protein